MPASPAAVALDDKLLEEIMQAYHCAAAHHQDGRLEQAAQLYHAIWQVHPRHAETNHGLGMLALRSRDAAQALPYLSIALDESPQQAHHWLHYIDALLLDGQADKAAQVLEIGQSRGLQGAEVDALLERMAPSAAGAPSDKAMNAVVDLYKQGQAGKAEAQARALTLRFPGHGFGWKVLANLFHTQGRFDEALPCMRKAARFLPNDHVAHNNLGAALNGRGRFGEAEASLRRALAIEPGYAEAHNNLAVTLQARDRLAEAEAGFRRALALAPDFSAAQINLGGVLILQGRLTQAQACVRALLERTPDFLTALDTLLFLLNYTSADQAQCMAEARRYGRQADAATTLRFDHWMCDAQPARLRIGFVSGDLRNHPVGFFLESLLAQFDQSRFELIAYPTVDKEDELSARIKPYFSAWTPLAALADDAAATVIHADGVHVLIDLAGHTSDNRLAVFARRPAPVQASWMGYFATTGLPQMDYVLGDPHVAPHSEADHFTERLWQLPESYLCFTAPAADIAVAPLPALSRGAVTFGCFNNVTKMNDAVVALWAAILTALPSARLYLKSKQFADAATREATARRFAGHGVARQRLLLEGYSSRAQHLADYHAVDIALDPFPYPGGTTSIEGLWMGVPVVTLRGDRFLSHIGETIAHNAGLPDWIAVDKDDYLAKAIGFAGDLDRLASLRAGLRQQVLASPLFQAPRFARHFEDAMQGMWRQFQSTKATQ